MSARSISLNEHQAGLVAKYVASGRFQNAAEVVEEGLRLIESRDAEEAAKLEDLRSAVDVGIAAIERGDFKEFATGDELASYLKARRTDAR